MIFLNSIFKNNYLRLTVLLFVSFLINSCATSFDKAGKYHTVRRGDDIWTIASVYRRTPQELAEYNNIADTHNLTPGKKLYIPSRNKTMAGYKKLPIRDSEPQSRKRTYASRKRRSEPANRKIYVNHNRFIWPTKGKLTSGYGIRNGRRHDGIDIANKKGTPIIACDKGSVVYSGKLKGYGNIVILKHSDGLFTVYAHNSKNLVRKNQTVKKGQNIAKMGCTGRCSGPHIHFEVRKGQIARNPLFFLPKNASAGMLAKRK